MGVSQRTYRFTNGTMLEVEPPSWFVKATAEDSDWSAELQRAGVNEVDKFENGGEFILIFRAPNGEYFIGYWDAAECVAEIFISSAVDYLLFRATYIAPIASLIMETERHDEWRKRNRFKAAS